MKVVACLALLSVFQTEVMACFLQTTCECRRIEWKPATTLTITTAVGSHVGQGGTTPKKCILAWNDCPSDCGIGNDSPLPLGIRATREIGGTGYINEFKADFSARVFVSLFYTDGEDTSCLYGSPRGYIDDRHGPGEGLRPGPDIYDTVIVPSGTSVDFNWDGVDTWNWVDYRTNTYQDPVLLQIVRCNT